MNNIIKLKIKVKYEIFNVINNFFYVFIYDNFKLLLNNIFFKDQFFNINLIYFNTIIIVIN